MFSLKPPRHNSDSTKNGRTQIEDISSALPPIPDIAPYYAAAPRGVALNRGQSRVLLA
jgi:hypothetical protein